MLAEYKTKSNVGIGFGLVLSIVPAVVLVAMQGNGRPDIGLVIGVLVVRLIGLALFIWGCGMYAMAKGRSGVNCLWGLLGLIGLIVLACMKDRSFDPNNPMGNGPRGFEVQPPAAPYSQNYPNQGGYPPQT